MKCKRIFIACRIAAHMVSVCSTLPGGGSRGSWYNEAAQHEYEEALALNPDHAEAGKALKKLR